MYASIYEAIEADSIEGVKKCLGDDIDFIEDGGWNPLHAACKKGNIDIVTAILDFLKSSVDAGFTINSEFEIIDPDLDYRGTALSEAFINDHTEVAKLLVENGADSSASFFQQSQDSPEWFFGDYDSATDCGLCFWLADQDLLSTMIDHGLDIDACDDNGKSALSHAVQVGDQDRVAMLLDFGANPNQVINHDEMGTISLLIQAVVGENTPIVEMLLKYSASLNYCCDDCDGETVIDIILEKKNPELDEIFGMQNVRNKMEMN